MELIDEIEAFKYENSELKKFKEKIVVDETITLNINDNLTRNFSISPDSLKEFAVGYMLGEGLINSYENVIDIEINNNILNTEINLEDFDIRKELLVGSDCFGGWRTKIDIIDEVESDFIIEPEELIKNINTLREKAFTWKQTGGTHIAGLVNCEKNEFIAIEDVSRHVAVDKIIGAAAIKNLDFSNSYIIYSGRMPADMLIKIARVGIPLIASNAAPTLSGYTVADKANITMIGFLREDRFNVYTHPHRIML
ncbi:formate dehydrogenase accessory sulfurtransferase FdhD [Methanobrevibacter curvatus]|uniref:Sulfur carrier protein FdhD n=1 Tax=Methanobrevibacter curvatus TaxID=49547 RepID=A0A162FKS5_9EURY|nr:formate dehydrogenase accessory sulfurtransferase FdhD [Methanobrevibacter curvatus]KZX11500.1 protein FdhD [Methanobrevibacter curvatus]